jgi:hypothetical protein
VSVHFCAKCERTVNTVRTGAASGRFQSQPRYVEHVNRDGDRCSWSNTVIAPYIEVFYFTQDLKPIESTREVILADALELARAAMEGKYAIEDTQKKPQPRRYDSTLEGK